ncbi:sorting nexin-7-like [Ostrinia furnacalis]|uniref:sorting nexin-7-like n=1 Tax=Ostrinia furnacalis TaxID=93504 RepID=UPI00103D82CB|nr:sorting nexin-7-like [Ostrinia furnacalis]
MASESSSAVLDLNDGDITEDTEPPSVTEDTNDGNEGIPLIMEHGYDIAVKVDAPLKQLSTLETFVTYRVRCVCARWPAPPAVRRRYNHFRILHSRLSAAHPLIAAPPLPPRHSARQQLDRYEPGFVRLRAMALHAFLSRVAKHPILTHSPELRTFLCTPDEELDKVFRGESSALNLWGGLSAKNDSKNTNGARVKDPEFSSAADYLTSLQQKLTTLCALTVKLHKGSAAVGNELMG